MYRYKRNIELRTNEMRLYAPTHKALFFLCVFMLAFGAFGIDPPSVAFAEEESAKLQAEADAYVTKIQETTAHYQETEAAVADLEARIASGQERVAELESKLPAQRKKAATSIRNQYLFQQSTGDFLGIVLSANSFDDFLTAMRYLDVIHERNAKEVNALVSMIDEINETQALLVYERDAATQKQAESLDALQQARDARSALQQRAEAAAQAEQEQREAAIRAASEAAAADEGATFITRSGNSAIIEVADANGVSIEPLLENVTSSEIGEWAARIDAYLAGSPLAGHGATFAQAAALYGVDPRLSPAISTIESGKGLVCFLPHNAWGWGSSSWPDWDTAIVSHVQGLANGYGGTLTIEGAIRYCGENNQEWYSSVAAEMSSI